jgi:HEAT repeat protein
MQEHIQYWMKTLETHPLIMVRKQAARHLGAMQSLVANTVTLIKALSDVNDDVRIQSAYSLGQTWVIRDHLRPLYELIEKLQTRRSKSAARSAIDKINAHEEFMNAA